MNGLPYSVRVKFEVIEAAHRRGLANPDAYLNHADIAREVRVSKGYVYKVLKEFRVTGYIQDPQVNIRMCVERSKGGSKLSPEASLYLLALRTEDDQIPLYVYKDILYEDLGISVSHQTVDTFFKKRFDFEGALRKSSPVPLDKFKQHNIERHKAFLEILAKLPDHFKYHFTDEKHVVNSDCMMDRVRGDPLTGRIRNILVTGSFREAYNLLAIISPSTTKTHPVYWVCGEQNGNAALYVAFLEHLISIRWFDRGDILIRDRCTIYDKAEAKIAEDILWNTVIDGHPLHVLTVPLPARAPEHGIPIQLDSVLAHGLAEVQSAHAEDDRRLLCSTVCLRLS